jgi:hypothetical protein
MGDNWYCAECLRRILGDFVKVEPQDQAPFYLAPDNLEDALKRYGTRTFSTFNGKIYLFAVTMVNGEYRCKIHLN